ncbi:MULTISPECIES: DNA helicase UvrD [unclassified Kaistella]|uniref:DNA helicase UvrD n=1 Tax=unclassified Kaistella TaxID=2762626 RepID=UPI002736B66F|nr:MULTISPECIES: DNA helicase UvrD [unclassified Kaistella]MDP2455112.1 DNA helicase UvrD [Kaistella sp. SH11-4b]MDP2458019.1 DNA helicase UvrD [Kaistella sp. SH40-3]MDP2460986.1 DNA helicase UvrD [Kaistella sp. SH19-2b]
MVNKRLILAVAGSGKTKYLIDNLDLEQRFLIVTYTNTSLNLIKSRIFKKFGFYPTNIKTKTYFEFIYGFCIKPSLLFKHKLKGIDWNRPPEFTTFLPKTNLNKYLTTKKYLYHNRLGQFAEFENIIIDINKRLEMFYDHFFYDEFQDLGGHDFNFMMQIVQANINFLFVGDFFQHTYVTSFDGRTNNTLYSNLKDYSHKIHFFNIRIDDKILSHSYRCSPTICRFVTQNLGINIESHRKDETEIIFVQNREFALEIINNSNIIKLVYDKSDKRNFLSKNWGDCKGEDDYNDTCIILNKTTARIFAKSKFEDLKPRTKNKLYVALTRTKGNCYIIDDDLINN